MRQISPERFQKELNGSKSRLLSTLQKNLSIAAIEMQARSQQVAFSRFKDRTGRLRQSIVGRFAIVGGNHTAILQSGGSGVEYARYIEFGTKYIEPRLFMGRSMEKQQQEIRPKLDDLLRVALQEE